MPTFRFALLLAAVALAGLAGCGDSPSGPANGSDVVGGVDVAALFAPPTMAERAQVESEWAGWSPAAEGVTLEGAGSASLGGEDVEVRVVSHLVQGRRHTGALLLPTVPPSEPVPVLLYLHGGDSGVDLVEVLTAVTVLGIRGRDAILVVPAFGGESLRFGGESWVAEGPSLPWTGDVEESLALLEVALETVAAADPSRIGLVGLSRGGAVGLLAGARDPRIRAVVSFFAPTDFFGPFVEGVVREVLQGVPPNLPGVVALEELVLDPLRQGTGTLDWARLELLRRSPARFADRLPAVQLHHGTADTVVPVEEAERLIAAMDALGRGEPAFEAHIYPGAGHNPFDMLLSLPRTAAFLTTHLFDGQATAVAALSGS